MNPKSVECWNKALEEFHKAETKIQSGENASIVITHCKNSVTNGIASITLMEDSEKKLAIGDFIDYGDEIKNKAVMEVLRITKRTLNRMRDSSPPEYNLPEP